MGMRKKSGQSASAGEANERQKEEPTNGEDELVLEFCGYEPQDDGQTECRSPERKIMLVAKQKLGHIPIVLESTFLIHPNRDFESARPLASCIYLVSYRRTHPVSIKNHPTPPIHPTRMCRGKNPMIAPRRNLPRMKKVAPVRREEKANATSVVAMTALGLSSPTISVISLVRILKNG